MTANGTPDTTSPARTAVLAVPLVQVDQLALAGVAGHIVLALRNPRDAGVLDTGALPVHYGVLMTRAGPDVSASTRAAAGVTLDELSGMRQPELARMTAMTSQSARKSSAIKRVAGVIDEIEVIRSGHEQTLAR